MPSETTDYCSRLNLPIPRVEDFVREGRFKLFDLLVVALLEHGGPLSIEAIATRLTAAGAQAMTAAAAALLDIGSRTIRTFVGDELADLPTALEAFDLVAAPWVRESLQAVGVLDADRFRLVDLKPPQKTRRLNRQGRTLTITPELLITSTTGISRPLGDPAKIAAYLAAGDLTKLRRRLESDVKALFAFYHYGVLHHWVRLRWGFLDETLPVDWAVPGDPNLYETLQACHAARRPIDVVWGSAPGWSDLWSRARRVTIVSFDVWCLVVEGDGQRWQLPRVEIQAARPSAETPDDDAAARQCESKPPSVEVSR